MSAIVKPILFLALANDRDDRAHYLRNLAEEARQVREALGAAEQRGRCELIVRQNATAGEILDVFQDARYRNRVAIFHFGGHANSYQLLLETATGRPAAADAGGLARFLAQQRGLQLVFLNGCSTQGQVSDLLDAGVHAVIATDQAVEDGMATEFAARFYRGLAGDAAIETAFKEARAAMEVQGGTIFRHLGAAEEEQPGSRRIPWQLYPPGAADRMDWSLAEAADDPFFGLPELPPLDVPDKPFRYLDWYRREDAEVFFGRGREIRELHDWVTAAARPPIILFYGQSGVGKSSLLAAGLLPRLEGSHSVRYVRRDQGKGLLGTLRAALRLDPGADLAAAWRAAEAQGGRPLLVVLDQVEELFTRPNSQQPDELAVFLTALTGLFADIGRRPQGRLVLSFRKEWLADIDKRLTEHHLPNGKAFLERLGRAGIAEVVAGPQATPRLRDHYRLIVADALPSLIADDLLADRESPVAPMLAILLTDMWDAAKARSYDRPTFDEDLYHEFRSRGLSLDDFLGRQLRSLHGLQPDIVDSGLALDLLAYHTTPLGTAEQRTITDLEGTYRHRQDVLPALVQECRDLYLLVDPSRNQPGQPRASRLTHDTLAQHVRKRFDESNAPGQRARRILESRAVNWQDGKTGPVLDGPDLAAVNAGRNGMRNWDSQKGEIRLIEASQSARKKRRMARAASVAVASAFLILAGYLLLQQTTILWSKMQIRQRNPFIAVSGANILIQKYEMSNELYSLAPQDIDAGTSSIANQLPVANIDARRALKFCEWLGGTLPSQAEWNKVAHTWPREAECDDPEQRSAADWANIQGNSEKGDPVEVASNDFVCDTTADGVRFLWGNVTEWTRTTMSGDTWDGENLDVPLTVLGGSYIQPRETLTDASFLSGRQPDPQVGFRCVMSR